MNKEERRELFYRRWLQRVAYDPATLCGEVQRFQRFCDEILLPLFREMKEGPLSTLKDEDFINGRLEVIEYEIAAWTHKVKWNFYFSNHSHDDPAFVNGETTFQQKDLLALVEKRDRAPRRKHW